MSNRVKRATTDGPCDEAVSPVIGVILMVAITVVMAAVVFVLVSGMRASSNHPDYISFIVDDLNDRLRVTKFEGDPSWGEFEIRTSAAGDFDYMGNVGSGPDALPAGVFVPVGGTAGGPPDAPVSAWMSISLCAEPAASDVQVTIRHIDPNALIFQGRFASLPDCQA